MTTVFVRRWPLLGVLLACGLSSCAPEPLPIAEAEYRSTIIGNWLGTVGDMKESMTFGAEGTFVAEVRPAGFLSNTLSQGVSGTISGTWTLAGTVITMNLTSAENELLRNKVTSSTIVAFRKDQLVVRSASGETSTFQRAV